jgi:alpha-beta hydrolase superfamily lysophospholipase
MLVAAHRGQGRVLLRSIDPSITDEADPLSVDPSLDPYDPRNGFRAPPEWSSYGPDFVARYRQAQEARVARLDAVARAWIAERKAAKGARAGHLARLMLVYRTSAALESVDRGLDPSLRDYGTLLSEDPPAQNLERLGYGRVVTPEAWLSTWSGLSSHADLAKTLPHVRAPVLVVHAGADREVLNQDLRAITESLRAEDRTVVVFDRARHYFEGPGDRAPAEQAMVDWLQARFAA